MALRESASQTSGLYVHIGQRVLISFSRSDKSEAQLTHGRRTLKRPI